MMRLKSFMLGKGKMEVKNNIKGKAASLKAKGVCVGR